MISTARRRFGLVLAVLAVVAVSCGVEDTDRAFVVGAGASAESRVLAEIYAQALARTGMTVRVHEGLGDRADRLAALDAGTVALVGEHTGELLSAWDSSSAARTPAEVIVALNRALPEGLAVTDPAEGADLRARLVLDAAVAEREGVRAIDELLPRCGQVTAGVAAVPGVLRGGTDVTVHGCVFGTVVDVGTPSALGEGVRGGAVQVGVLTGPLELVPGAVEGTTVLADDDYAVRAQNVVPVLREGLLDEIETRKLNYVAGELTTAELAELIRVVEAGESPADPARRWLDAHGL